VSDLNRLHNHMTRDIKPPGQCSACDEYRQRLHGRLTEIEVADDRETLQRAIELLESATSNSLLAPLRQSWGIERDRTVARLREMAR